MNQAREKFGLDSIRKSSAYCKLIKEKSQMEFENLNETVRLSIKKMNELLNKKALTPEEISTLKVLSDFIAGVNFKKEQKYMSHQL